MSSLAQRGQVITLLREAMVMGARQDRACAAICLSERTGGAIPPAYSTGIVTL